MVFNVSLYTYYSVIQQLKAKEMYPSLSSILAESSGLGLIYQMASTPIETNTKHVLLSAMNKMEQVNFTCPRWHAVRDEKTKEMEDKT